MIGWIRTDDCPSRLTQKKLVLPALESVQRFACECMFDRYCSAALRLNMHSHTIIWSDPKRVAPFFFALDARTIHSVRIKVVLVPLACIICVDEGVITLASLFLFRIFLLDFVLSY